MSIMRLMVVCFLVAASCGAAFAQEFEVVAVKPNKSASNSSHTNSTRGLLRAENLPLKRIVMMAYDLKDYQVEGPDWITVERYDIVAKFPEALPKERDRYRAALQSMLQKMLADRFKLVSHRDQKVFPVYGLTVGKKGIKFKQVPDGDSHNGNSNNRHYEGTCIAMSTLAEFLSGRLAMPVLDQTGLKGFYDVKFDWEEDIDTPDNASRPTLRYVLEDQLGLKLETKKAPLDILIVDRAEKVPTEN